MASTPFGSPFDDTDADIIIRSSDQVDFYFYRVILSKSSPVFKSMFSPPQPNAGVSEKRVIDFTEDSRTIAILLSCIYPVMGESMVDDLLDALVAARKYDMAGASQRLHTALKRQLLCKEIMY